MMSNFVAKTIQHSCNNCGKARSEHDLEGECPGQVKYAVAIKQIHEIVVTVSVPEGASREDIWDAAEQAALNASVTPTEYNRTMEKESWTITDPETGNHYEP